MIEKIEKNEYDKIQFLGQYIKENFSKENIGEHELIYIYKLNEEILGFIQIQVLYETMDIINISVAQEYRRKKIGQSLLNYVINLHQPERIMLEVRESNEALKFYQNNEFKEIRRIKNYYGNEDGIVMERRTM